MSILTFDASTVTFNGATVYFNGPPPGAFTADEEIALIVAADALPLVAQAATAGLRRSRDTMRMRWRGQ